MQVFACTRIDPQENSGVTCFYALRIDQTILRREYLTKRALEQKKMITNGGEKEIENGGENEIGKKYSAAYFNTVYNQPIAAFTFLYLSNIFGIVIADTNVIMHFSYYNSP